MVLPKKSLYFETFSVLKNSLTVGTPLEFAWSATFLDGSKPRIFSFLSRKFLSNVPSLDPISIILDSECK